MQYYIAQCPKQHKRHNSVSTWTSVLHVPVLLLYQWRSVIFSKILRFCNALFCRISFLNIITDWLQGKRSWLITKLYEVKRFSVFDSQTTLAFFAFDINAHPNVPVLVHILALDTHDWMQIHFHMWKWTVYSFSYLMCIPFKIQPLLILKGVWRQSPMSSLHSWPLENHNITHFFSKEYKLRRFVILYHRLLSTCIFILWVWQNAPVNIDYWQAVK